MPIEQRRSSRQSESAIRDNVTVQDANRTTQHRNGVRLLKSGSTAYRLFLDGLNLKGFDLQKVRGDGNCLFRAVSHQVYGNDRWHAVVREKCVKYMKAHKERFKGFIARDFDAYLDVVATLGEWGDEPEIQAMVEIYARPAQIWVLGDTQEAAKELKTFHSTTLLGADAPNPLRLSYFGGCHYDSITSTETAEAAAASVDAALEPGVVEEAAVARRVTRRHDLVSQLPSARERQMIEAAIERSLLDLIGLDGDMPPLTGGTDGGTGTVEEGGAAGHEYPVNCVCGRTDERSGLWILCGNCCTWLHPECEALDEDAVEAMDGDYVCSRCDEKGTPTVRRSGKRRHGTSTESRPCTKYCTGCRRGEGCEVGMGEVSDYHRKKIVQFTLDEITATGKHMARRRSGEMVLVKQPHPSKRKKRGRVIKWSRDQAAIIYEGDEKHSLEAQSRLLVPCALVYRIPPGRSEEWLEERAKQVGCSRAPPYRKQLAYEVRRARKELLKRGFIEKNDQANLNGVYRVKVEPPPPPPPPAPAPTERSTSRV
mmetsp:Transcript_14569/g.29896  ORF Transcript_14569/g.29896 Transcript_14569/m.29896 type:complete len:539 (-) Transcript_14569:877-2493(-)